MKIEIPKDQLVKAIERCDVVADSKTPHPHTGKVLLTASEDANQQVLQAYCTDLKIQVDTAVAASVEKPGSVAVDCKRLLSVARAMPSGAIRLDAKPERRLVVSCAGQRAYGLPTVDAELFPTPNEPTDAASRLQVEARVLASMISRVQSSIDSKDRPNLEGVYLDYQDGTLNAVAVGNHTIGIVSESVGHEGPWAALLPRFMLKSVVALCNENKIVTLALDDPLIYIETEDTLIGSLLPRDPFVPWRNGVDSLQRTPVARVPALMLRDSLQAITVARQEQNTPISIVVEGDKMTLALVGEECNAEDQVVVEPLTEPKLRKLVNPTYLMEAVRGADATFSLEDTGSSIAISTDDYLGIICLVNPEAWPGAFD